MKIVTFYTDKYFDLALRCAESGARFGYDIVMDRIEDTGSWLRNTAKKADIVLKHLKNKKPFIITDADSIINSEIDYKIFDGWFFAARVKGGSELLSGTMFFRPSSHILALVQLWRENIRKEPRILEQQHLHKALISLDIKFLRLPTEYCTIFDESDRPSDPVITHYQASRKFRGKLSGENKELGADDTFSESA